MGFSKEHREEIKKFIIDTIDMRENPYKKVLEKYPVSRQTVSKYIKGLLEENIIEKSEKNEYQLKCSSLPANNQVLNIVIPYIHFSSSYL